MFKKIAQIIPRLHNENESNKIDSDQLSLLNLFSQNLELFDSLAEEKDRHQLYQRIVSNFNKTFFPILPEQANLPQVKNSIDKYCAISSQFASYLIDTESKFTEFIDSFIYIYHNYSTIPHSEQFINFFYDTIQNINKNSEITETIYNILSLLFRSPQFYQSFLAIDGITFIFTTFFLKFVSKQCQIKFLHLLYDNVPKELAKFTQQSGLLELFVSSLTSTSKDSIPKESILFIQYYLTNFHRFDKDIYLKFDDLHGFLNLNNYLILNDQETGTECYQKMLTESNGDQAVISNLFIFYTREETKPETRTSILNLFYTISSNDLTVASKPKASTSSIAQGLDLIHVSAIATLLTGEPSHEQSNHPEKMFIFQKIFEIAPIQLWILPPPSLNREGLMLIATYLKELSRAGAFSIELSLDAILTIIKPPIKSEDEIPIDNFLELIEAALENKELNAQELLDKKFIEDFILLQNDEDVALYFDKHILFRSIIAKIYSSGCSGEFIFPIIQKFISASKLMKNMKEFTEFIQMLISKNFLPQIIQLLLNYLTNKDLLHLLQSEMKKRRECYHCFLDANGFIYLDEFLTNNTEQANEVIHILASLSYSSPKREVNEWILKQNKESVLFSLPKETLEKAAYAFRNDTSLVLIPALFPFIREEKFDSLNLMNLSLVGKYGIPMYQKVFPEKKFEEIPFINFISDRYLQPENVLTILNSETSSLFVHRSLPHFSVYSFIPDIFEKSYFKIGYYRFVSIYFNFPHIFPSAIKLFHNKYFCINVEANSLNVISKNTLIASYTITENKWNHILFNFKHSKKRLEISINQQHLSNVEIPNFSHTNYTESNNNISPNQDNNTDDAIIVSYNSFDDDGMCIIVGDDEKEIGGHFIVAKKILVSDQPQNDINNIWNILPIHSYRNLDDAYIAETESVFISHYQGFASYFNTLIDIQEIFIRFENEKELSKLRAIFELLLKIQIVNAIPEGRFWDRLLLAMKRQHEIIQKDLLDFAFHIPKAYYDTNNKIVTFLCTILNDLEFIFVFPIDQILHLLKFIEGELEMQFDLSEESTYQYMQSIFIALRSGIDEKIVLALIPIFSLFISKHPSIQKFRFMFNTATSSCDWNQAMNYSLPDYPISTLVSLDLVSLPVSNSLLTSFLNLALKYECELYTYNELVEFMLLYDDERAISFAKLICLYSLRNPKYINNSLLANYAFSCHCDNREFWIVSFSILFGKLYSDLPKDEDLIIEQKDFLSVILEMISKSCAKYTSNYLLNNDIQQTKLELISEIFGVIFKIRNDNFSYFMQNNCQIPLYILSNIGIIPKSIIHDWERVECNFLNYTPSHLSKEDLDRLINLCDSVSPFTKIIKEFECIQIAQTSSNLFNDCLQFPFDVSSTDYISKLPFITHILNLFSSILFSAPPNNFGNLLNDFVVGHSFMYNSYSRWFGQELVFMAIIKITMSNVELDLYHKPLIQIIEKMVKKTLFDEKIIHLASLFFNLLKNLQIKHLFNTIMKDPIVLNSYREIILGILVILNGHEKLKEAFQLFVNHKSVVFYSPLFENREFSLFWIHITRTNHIDDEVAISCMEIMMKTVPETFVAEYKSDEVEQLWKQQSSKYCKQYKDEQNTTFNRGKKAKMIQSYEQQKLSISTNEQLFVSLFRVCNLYIQSNYQIFLINLRNKISESSFYQMMKVTRSYLMQKEFTVNSYRLSSNPLPLYNSRCVSPSPYSIKIPTFSKKLKFDDFKLEPRVFKSRIEQIEQKGILNCSPEWFYFHSYEKEYLSPFDYSYYIPQIPNQLMKLFIRLYRSCGRFISCHNVNFFYYIHTIPSVLFITDKAILLLVLAQVNQNRQESTEYNINDYEIDLIPSPQRPVAFLPLTEAISLNEYHHTSLFNGHLVLIIDFDRFIKTQNHLYLHKPIGLQIISLFDPTTIVIFTSNAEMETCDKTIVKSIQSSPRTPLLKQLPLNNLVFSIGSILKAKELWDNGNISNNDYLLLLNNFGGRSFSDLSQYPIFPWVVSPTIQPRDLTLPMGQLNPDRAQHFDTTYEVSDPKYYYGFHYSIPGIVFWLLMRLPPFTYFGWDLNRGWDDKQRLFVSIQDAYTSASQNNPSDLKELIPELYSVPEALLNLSHLDFSEAEINENVALPEWSSTPYRYIDVMRKNLETTSNLNDWIDLIFGYKETGEAALQAKNLFLPTSYHSSTPDSLNMEPSVFEAQVINFGQCPIQLFFKHHQPRKHKLPLINFTTIFSDENLFKFDVHQIPNSELLNHKDISGSSANNMLTLLPMNIPNSNITALESINTVFTTTHSHKTTKLHKDDELEEKNKYYKNVALCDVGCYAMPLISCAIPPRFYHFMAIDPINECLTLNSITTKKVQFRYNNSIFASASNISMCSSGMFCAVTFSFGTTKVYRIIYKSQKPISLEQICSFTYHFEPCDVSALFTDNFICATSFHSQDNGNHLVFWNYSTSLIHRIVDLTYKPVAMICDDVIDTLTVVGPLIIEQYSINGKLLHSFDFTPIAKSHKGNELTTAALLAYNYDFDGRLIVCGDKSGNINFFVVDEISYELVFLISKSVHSYPITSLFILKNRNRIITSDKYGNRFVTRLEINDEASQKTTNQAQNPTNQNDEVTCCAYCENMSTTKCFACGLPLCDNCVVVINNENQNENQTTQLCPNCACEILDQNDDQNNENYETNQEAHPRLRRLSSYL